MRRIYSNREDDHDEVDIPFSHMLENSARAYLAAPYFTIAAPLLKAVDNNCNEIKLLIELNAITRPNELRKLIDKDEIKVKYFTSGFHAKIYVFDKKVVLLGSANLTRNGLAKNREAVIKLDREEDSDAIEEVIALFDELWESGTELDTDKLDEFEEGYKELRRLKDAARKARETFESTFGRVCPDDAVESKNENPYVDAHLKDLWRLVYNEYHPAFHSVMSILDEVMTRLEGQGIKRLDIRNLSSVNQTERFLFYVKDNYVYENGNKDWKANPRQFTRYDRRRSIIHYGEIWFKDLRHKVSNEYTTGLRTIEAAFATSDKINAASADQIMAGLMALHAFYGQRARRGNVEVKFWNDNPDVNHVKACLIHLLHGSQDFIPRFRDVTKTKGVMKLAYIGKYTGFELVGNVNPKECPPVNSGVAKTLRFLGFDVTVEGAESPLSPL